MAPPPSPRHPPRRTRPHSKCTLLLSQITIMATTIIIASAATTHHWGIIPSRQQQRPPFAAFASGGFGAKTTSGKKKKGAKKKSGGNKSNAATTSSATTIATNNNSNSNSNSNINNLRTPEARMSHIRSRVNSLDLSPMARLTLQKNNPSNNDDNGSSSNLLTLDIDPNAISIHDNFLGPQFLSSLRSEAQSLLPRMIPSQSSRWDEQSQSVVVYDKHQVLSTQIVGGVDEYAHIPHLVEYVAIMTEALSEKLNGILPERDHLSGTEQTNKLAVCLGDGSRYDKHIDNLGGGEGKGDRRKLTALLYLQEPPSPSPTPPPPGDDDTVGDDNVVGNTNYPNNESYENDPKGGYFRAHDVPTIGEITSIAPKGDRLLLFWSDSLVHDVTASYAPKGEEDRRWALTIWFLAKGDGSIRDTDVEVEKRHFS